MVQPRIHPPPPISTPKEAPWTDIQTLITKLDILISVSLGLPPGVSVTVQPPAAPGLPPTIVTVPPPGVAPVVVTPPEIVIPPTAPGLLPVIPTFNGRLDALVQLTRNILFWGQATGGSKSKLMDLGQNWETNCWQGYEITFVTGQGAGQTRLIKSNDYNSIIPRSDWTVQPDRTTLYLIRTTRTLANKTTFTTGQKDVTTAGTAEQLPDVAVPDGCQLTILAKPGNTDYIYLGNSKENAESSSGRFDGLDASIAVSLKVTNANKVWVDAGVNGEGISYIVEQD